MIYKSNKIRWVKLRLLTITNGWKRASYLKRKNVFMEMGDGCYYHTRDLPAEPYLVKLHNDVRIAADVRLITHDIASYMINNISKYEEYGKARYYMGTIEIFDHVMIGAGSKILPNVKIGPNVIVAAGSIVTKDIPENSVVAGVPARVIGTFDDFAKKRIRETKCYPEKKDGINEILSFFGIRIVIGWKEDNEECISNAFYL